MKILFHAKTQRRKRFLFVLLIGALFIGCKSKETVGEHSSSNNSSSGKMQQVELHLTSTQSYCGGAEPDESVLIELGRPKTYEGRSIYIRKGNWNDLTQKIVASGKSDANGNVLFQLEKGEYCVMFDDKKDDTIYNSILTKLEKGDASHEPVDKVCLAEWIKKAEYVFSVDASTTSFTFNVHINCPWYSVPCTNYIGPMPP